MRIFCLFFLPNFITIIEHSSAYVGPYNHDSGSPENADDENSGSKYNARRE